MSESPIVVVNFAHPLTPEQLGAIGHLAGQQVERVVDVKTQMDNDRPFADQARALVEAAGLTPEEWQTEPILVNLPGLATVAALLLAELHGRMGHFPAVLRLRPAPGATPSRFEVAEILNLQAVREAARERR
jgi:hypothetical protein